MSLTKPCPKVTVFEWSKKMRLRRRFEVNVRREPRSDRGDSSLCTLARFETKEEAEAYADAIREALDAALDAALVPAFRAKTAYESARFHRERAKAAEKKP